MDRKKDLIIRGGFNVYPREIEEVLYEHPAVAEAAVIGLPHPALGEEVGAAVALKPGADITPEELRNHVKAHVAAYKYPRHVWIVDVLPKGQTGKIQKRDIVPRPTRPHREAAAARSPGWQGHAGRAAGGRVPTCPIEPDALRAAEACRFHNLVAASDLQRRSWAGGGHAACSYSWISPPRTLRRRILAVRPVTRL